MEEKKYKIGICGVGMIGGAVKRYFENKKNYQLFLYDKKGIGSLEELNQADFIYICVPTPYKENLGCDTSIIEEAIKQIRGEKTIIIKSTVIPGTTDVLQKKYPQHKLLVNPEFLTELTADQDMKYPDRQIVGYTEKSYTIAKDILQQLPLAPFERIVPAFIAEFSKYGGNTWFVVKVSKNNEFYDLFKAFGGNDKEFESVIDCMSADKRIGRSHLKIFHKGYRGYGDMKVSKCLPKDTKALLKFASKLKVKMPVLEAADKYNDELVEKQKNILKKINESKRDNGISGRNMRIQKNLA